MAELYMSCFRTSDDKNYFRNALPIWGAQPYISMHEGAEALVDLRFLRLCIYM